MPGIGHLAVGLAAARWGPNAMPDRPVVWAGLLVSASFLPDADVISFALGIPYGAPYGHRGALHSLGAAAALAVLAGFLAWLARGSPWRVGLAFGLVLASHGLLDTLTDGGRGIALLWPYSDRRLFSSWRPIPVAPLGLGVLSPRGLKVMMREVLLLSPVFALGLWPRRRPALTAPRPADRFLESKEL
jgi:inner membrane protein